MTITVEQRRASKMLADASTRGCAEAVLRAQGFDAAMLGELINAGLVSRRRALGRYRETADYEGGAWSDPVSSAPVKCARRGHRVLGGLPVGATAGDDQMGAPYPQQAAL